jgi:heme a synthase
MRNTSEKSPVLIYRHRRSVILWLALCAALVAGMVLVGGYTRLSGSGLSITAWKPIHGSIPPLNQGEWEEEFAAYKQSPQFQKVNSDMGLDDFKRIFWPEFLHRLLGRLIGIVFLFPLLFFALRKSISRRFGWRLAGIFALGGLQGLIGWLMVASGLVDMPRVSHIRLALHLSVAFAIFALILWAIMDNLPREKPLPFLKRRMVQSYKIWYFLLCLQIVLGAFMAGLHAGLIYNTWPDMNGQFLPDDIMAIYPWYMNFIDNHAFIQFAHRTLAILLAAGFAFWWYCHREYVKRAHLGRMCAVVAFILAAQFTLGVLTLLQVVPLPLALAHQMTALVLFAAGLALWHALATHRPEFNKVS